MAEEDPSLHLAESINVIRYTRGQQFKEHFDFGSDRPSLRRNATLLIYLCV